MIEKIQQAIGDFKIICVYKTGSQLFCENCKDLDYTVVVGNWDKDFKAYNIDGVDYFCYSVAEFEKKIKMTSGRMSDLYAVETYLYEPVYGINPIPNYNWADYKDKSIETVLRCGEMNYFNPNVVCTNDNGEVVCSKTMCWALAIMYVIENGQPVFNAEQKAILQQCHDLMLTRNYSDLLQNEIAVKMENENGRIARTD